MTKVPASATLPSARGEAAAAAARMRMQSGRQVLQEQSKSFTFQVSFTDKNLIFPYHGKSSIIERRQSFTRVTRQYIYRVQLQTGSLDVTVAVAAVEQCTEAERQSESESERVDT